MTVRHAATFSPSVLTPKKTWLLSDCTPAFIRSFFVNELSAYVDSVFAASCMSAGHFHKEVVSLIQTEIVFSTTDDADSNSQHKGFNGEIFLI